MLQTIPMAGRTTANERPSRVASLSAATTDGKRYERSASVQDEIHRMLDLPATEWIAQAGDLQNETLVFLIRHTHRTHDEVCGGLMQKLQSRIAAHARRFTQNLDPIDEEDLVLKLEMKILDLVLTPEASRKREFLEVAFAQATNRLALDILKQRDNSPEGHQVEAPRDSADDSSEEATDQAIDFVLDTRPSPEMVLVESQDGTRRYDLSLKAYMSITDRRHLHAAILHYCHGVPITCKQRGKRSLQRHFRKDPRQIRYWIATALAEMRAAIGEGTN